jgi:predicted O-methyltransferase YrrM
LESRKQIQSLGINITPVNFYANTPSISEIQNSFEYSSELPPYMDESIFNQKNMTKVLLELDKYSHEFNPETAGDEITCESFFWQNSQFSYSDAMAYYTFIRKQKPAKIVEIGSGFSSLVALEAIKKNGMGELICIEPFPRPFIEKLADKKALNLVKKLAQEITPDYLNGILNDRDILFIDSTHTVKTGSDCLHIYLRLLPKIRKNLLVHVHDVFLPFGMPQKWLLEFQIFWTEQYLLFAWLLDNPKTTALYGSHYHKVFSPELLDRFMSQKSTPGGGSFWFNYQGNTNTNAKIFEKLRAFKTKLKVITHGAYE